MRRQDIICHLRGYVWLILLSWQSRSRLVLFTEKNAERVERQKETPMFVIIGNPPYNAGQVDENDNNKNRKYETMDARVRETYSTRFKGEE